MNIVKKITTNALVAFLVGSTALVYASAAEARTPVAYSYFTVSTPRDAKGSLYVDSNKIDATTELSGASVLGLNIKATSSSDEVLHNMYYEITDSYYLGRTYTAPDGKTIKQGNTYHYAKKGNNSNSINMSRTA